MVLGVKSEDQSVNNELKNKYITSYLDLFSFWNAKNHSSKPKYKQHMRVKLYRLKILNPRLEGFIYKVKSIYRHIKVRAYLISNNKSYRKHIIKNKIFIKS